jgi:hypothetical protein
MVLPAYYKSNFPWGMIDESWVPSDLVGKVFLVDGRGMLPHFWWLATVESLD